MKISFIHFCKLLAVMAILFFTSCQDDIVGGSANPNTVLRVSLDPALQLQTRNVNQESLVATIYYMIFDENGTLESKQVFDSPPAEVTFTKLASGHKTLFVIANINRDTYRVTPSELNAITSLAELRSLKLTNDSPMVAGSQLLPMIHVRELELPLLDPSIVVDLTRQVARLTLDNDMVPDKWAQIDSISFQGLTKEVRLVDGEETTSQVQTPDGTFCSDTIPAALYLLPAERKQISYVLYGKTKLGVTQIAEGQIVPQLAKNNSYRLRLSTGEVTEMGVPSDLAVSIDPSVGIYSASDTTLTLFPDGGTFSVYSSSFDEVGIGYSDTWLSDVPSARAVKKPFHFAVSSSSFITADTLRQSAITLFNSFDPTRKLTIKVKQEGENRGPKYYVILVGGQSNASGRDRSPFNSLYDNPDPRVFQLGQAGLNMPYPGRFTSASTLSIIPLLCNAQNLDSHLMSLKSMHLSLGKQILPHIPVDYKVLVISVGYSGSGFELLDSEGIYDPVEMRVAGFPKNLASRYKIEARKGIFFNMMVDRVKYVLKMNKRNRFLGVVWSQGEVDANTNISNPVAAYIKFQDFAQTYCDVLNQEVSNEQLPGGFAGKHLWYPIDCVPIRKDWHRNVNPWMYATAQVFGSYKVWNPDTYISIPMDVKMNAPAYNDDGHFGQDAFPEVIVPRIVSRMKENGIFENRVSVPGNTFKRVITNQEALSKTGTINDADIQSGLLVCLPFHDVDSVTANLSHATVPASIRNHGMSLVKATGLTDIHGKSRTRFALSLRPSDGTYMSILKSDVSTVQSWSVSFMLRRTDGEKNFLNRYLLRVPGQNIGLSYHQYGIESEGGYLGIAFQPDNAVYNRFSSVVARLNDADFVRTPDEWIHYSVSYNHATRICKMYMNGQITMSKTLLAGQPAPTIGSLQLNDPTAGIGGQLMDLYIWNKEVPAETLFKTYVMSYYGLTK